MASRPEPLQQRELRSVSDRVAGRIGSHGEVQSQHRGYSTGRPDAQIEAETSLDPAVLRARDPEGLRYRVLRETGCHPCGLHVCGESCDRSSTTGVADIDWSCLRRHRAIIQTGPYRRLTRLAPRAGDCPRLSGSAARRVRGRSPLGSRRCSSRSTSRGRGPGRQDPRRASPERCGRPRRHCRRR